MGAVEERLAVRGSALSPWQDISINIFGERGAMIGRMLMGRSMRTAKLAGKRTSGENYLTSAMTAADEKSAKIIGTTSNRIGAGVSLTARSLSEAYSGFGRKTLLVDLSQSHVEGAAVQHQLAIDPSAVVASERPNLWTAHMLRARGVSTRNAYRTVLDDLSKHFDCIIVDLPPVLPDQIKSAAEMLAPIAACDLVFIVCLTGASTRNDVAACVETCRIGGVKLGGLILNDRQLPASGILMLEPKKTGEAPAHKSIQEEGVCPHCGA